MIADSRACYTYKGTLPNLESPILMTFGTNIVVKEIFDPYFLFIDVEGVKTTLKVRLDFELLKIISFSFSRKLMKSMFF